VVFIKGFTDRTKSDHLQDIFSNYGGVLKVEMRSGKVETVKYALISFSHLVHALKAIAYMNNGLIDGNKVYCDIYKDKEQRHTHQRSKLS